MYGSVAHVFQRTRYLVIMNSTLFYFTYVAFLRSFCVHDFSLVKEICLYTSDKIYNLFVVTVDRGVVVRMY